MEWSLTEIVGLTEKVVSLPILVWILLMVRINRRSIDEFIRINRSSHYGLHRKIEKLPCMRNDSTPCPTDGFTVVKRVAKGD